MLFINRGYEIVSKEMSFGRVSGITIGEPGRGRREIFLPTPVDLNGTIGDLERHLTIGYSRSGRPKICRGDEGMYLILSSEKDYTRKGCGRIKVPVDQRTEVIARGIGADGDAGRIGNWDVVLVKAEEDDVFRVTWSGYGYGYPATFYVVHHDLVYYADQPYVEVLYEAIGIDMPFSLEFDGNTALVSSEEWREL